VELVELTRVDGAGVVAAVGPLHDSDAEAYAAELRGLVEAHPDSGLSVTTKAVQSTSGDSAGAPVAPAVLLRKALSRTAGE
jgi:hypothetical protein